MTTALANIAENTRSGPRYHVRLPVLVSAEGDSSKVPVPGLACEISQRGMALYGGIDLLPGDLMEVQFQNSAKLRVSGIVRNRSGFCFGLEFLDAMASPEAISKVLEPTGAEEETSSWQTWFATHRGDVAVGIAGLLLFLTFLSAGSPPQPVQSKAYQPSLTLSERMLVALGLAEPPPPPVAVGNPNAQVWVDVHTGLYYCQGAELYGKSPDGKLTTQRDAQLDQFEPAARRNCN
ncbi:MAG: PilZ domain-containing protein [Acidobacteriaceae bacterium]|nr:PilZ domain-containing protein [Acidobacteriaceae bacterium]